MSSQRRQLSEAAAERLRVALIDSVAITDSIDSIISNVGDCNDLGDMPPGRRRRRSLQRRRRRSRSRRRPRRSPMRLDELNLRPLSLSKIGGRRRIGIEETAIVSGAIRKNRCSAVGQGEGAMRIAVTGIGAVTPLGIGREELWSRLLAGKHAFAATGWRWR